MYLIGDVHGKIEEYKALLKRRIPAGERSLQLGDMGVGFSDVNLPVLEGHRFIRGNHDAPDQCRAHPNYLGDYGLFKLGEKTVFYLAGAFSIDYMRRVPGVSWWEDEQLSQEHLDVAYALYVAKEPDIVVSHECPSKATEELLRPLLLNKYCYFNAKQDCANSSTAQALQRMLDAHQPELWVFGHYHIDREFWLRLTKFRCLAELSCMELS